MSDWLSEREKKKADEEAEVKRKKETQLRREQEESESIAYIVSANQQKWEWINQVIVSYAERYNRTVAEAPYGKESDPAYCKLYHYRQDDKGLIAICFSGKPSYDQKIYPFKIVIIKFIDESHLALSIQDRKERRLCVGKDTFDLFLAFHDSDGFASEYKPINPSMFEHYIRLVESSTLYIDLVGEADISEWIRKAVTDPKLPDPPSLPSSWQGRPPAKSSCLVTLLIWLSGLVITILIFGKLIHSL